MDSQERFQIETCGITHKEIFDTIKHGSPGYWISSCLSTALLNLENGNHQTTYHMINRALAAMIICDVTIKPEFK
jgi:hypothetical protein